jgi:hypothetical protein
MFDVLGDEIRFRYATIARLEPRLAATLLDDALAWLETAVSPDDWVSAADHEAAVRNLENDQAENVEALNEKISDLEARAETAEIDLEAANCEISGLKQEQADLLELLGLAPLVAGLRDLVETQALQIADLKKKLAEATPLKIRKTRK